MNIIVFGATGRTGKELVAQALTVGHSVTAFARSPSKLQLTHPNLKVVKGDIIHYQQVEEAISNQDAVLSALGAASPFRFDQTVVDGMGHIIRAMESSGVTRLIYMSAILVGETRAMAGMVMKYLAPVLLSTEITGHEVRENMIRNSRLQWTLVRAGTLTNGKQRKNFRSGENIGSRRLTATISRADVAYFMLQQLGNDVHVQKAPVLMY